MMPIAFNKSQRRPMSPVAERGESSVSRKRARSPPPPRRVPLRYYSDDDDDDENNDVVDDGSHGRDDDDDDREEDEEQSRTEDEHDSSRGYESSGGSDADDDVVEGSDDDRPIRVVSRRGSTSTAPASTPAQAPAPSSSDSSSVIRNVTVENSSAFDCSICYVPLKSPSFQCLAGHVVCSSCHDKLGQATSCHVCRVPTPDGYFRCNAMEQVVNTIRIPCPHAIHGCAEKPVYHDRDAHAQTCTHKPCHCPGEGCEFAGPVQTMLLEHFAAVHSWPCSAGNTGLPSFSVRLRKGINVVVTAGATTEQQYTLVLNVYEAAPVCNAITAFCIHPSNTGTVRLHLYYYDWQSNSDLCSWYLQSSHLEVVCTDLSNGMPSCFKFLVPKWSATEGEDDDIDIRLSVLDCGTSG